MNYGFCRQSNCYSNVTNLLVKRFLKLYHIQLWLFNSNPLFCSLHRKGIWLRRPIRPKCFVLMVVGFMGTHVITACARSATKTPYSGRTTVADPVIQVSQKSHKNRLLFNCSVLASTVLLLHV